MTDPLLGTSLGAYRLDSLLGEGGMGRVYAAVELRTGRAVAVKVIADEHARQPELVARFYAEAHAASRIRHRGIIEVLELAYLEDGRPAIVMELLAGETLRALIARGEVPLATAADVMTQVLDAIDAAHEAGIIHRDLKPDNIIIDRAGRVKVLDFGIAKLTGLDPAAGMPKTRTGMMMGTPEYMAPEQVMGGAIDVRSDIYAAGIVLYETLTGRRPFEGDNQFLILRMHLETTPPWPSSLRQMPEALAQVAMTAMAKSPAERFASAHEMAHALRGAMLERTTGLLVPTPAPHASVAANTVAVAPSRSGLLIGVAIAACVAIGVGAVMIAKHRRPVTTPAATAAPVATAKPTAPPPPPSIPPRPVDPRTPWYARLAAPANPKHYDFSAALPAQTELARKFLPDAQVRRIKAYEVAADGTVDLTSNRVDLVFWSPAAGVRPPGVAANVAVRERCAVAVAAHVDETLISVSDDTCDGQPLPAPRCTFKQIWDRAKKKGAHDQYVALIAFGEGAWDFGIYNVPEKDRVELQFANDCVSEP